MNSPTEERVAAAFRDLVADQPFIPDVSAIEQRARQARLRHRMVQGGIGAGVVAVAAVTAVSVASSAPSTPTRTAQASGTHPATAHASASPSASTSASASASTQQPLVQLAAVIAAEPQPKGNATLVERETTLAGHATVKVWDLYADDGRYFFSQTESGLPAQVQEDNNQADGQFAREVAAAAYAVTSNLDTAALKMAWAPDTTPVPAYLKAQVKEMSAGGLQIDNYVWEGCEDALVVGSGNPQVRAGVLRLVSALPGVSVTHGIVDGQPTLTLAAGADELGGEWWCGRVDLPGDDNHQRSDRHSAEDGRRPGRRPRRHHRHLEADPGQPGRRRRRQVLICVSPLRGRRATCPHVRTMTTATQKWFAATTAELTDYLQQRTT